METLTVPDLVGRRVSYEDASNPRREGTVVATTWHARWSTRSFEILWDEGDRTITDLRQHGWDLVEELAR